MVKRNPSNCCGIIAWTNCVYPSILECLIPSQGSRVMRINHIPADTGWRQVTPCHICYLQTDVSPAKASDQHSNDKGAQQSSNGKDRHCEGVHECQRLLTESCSISTQHCLVVKVLYVLCGQEIEEIGRRKRQWERQQHWNIMIL